MCMVWCIQRHVHDRIPWVPFKVNDEVDVWVCDMHTQRQQGKDSYIDVICLIRDSILIWYVGGWCVGVCKSTTTHAHTISRSLNHTYTTEMMVVAAKCLSNRIEFLLCMYDIIHTNINTQMEHCLCRIVHSFYLFLFAVLAAPCIRMNVCVCISFSLSFKYQLDN